MLAVNELLKVFPSYYHFLQGENPLRITSIFYPFQIKEPQFFKRQKAPIILYRMNVICNLLYNKSDVPLTKTTLISFSGSFY